MALMKPAADREKIRSLDRPSLEAYQLERLSVLLHEVLRSCPPAHQPELCECVLLSGGGTYALEQGLREELRWLEVLPQNRFYAKKLSGLQLPLKQVSELAQVPFTTKDQLVGADANGWAAHRTYPVEQYTRFHQTSGTHGQPLILLDTPEDWQWWIDCWHYVLDAAEITAADRCMLAFSFGPFIGFWTAFDALIDRGCLVLPGGGLSSMARLQRIETAKATCLLCTPSYA